MSVWTCSGKQSASESSQVLAFVVLGLKCRFPTLGKQPSTSHNPVRLKNTLQDEFKHRKRVYLLKNLVKLVDVNYILTDILIV